MPNRYVDNIIAIQMLKDITEILNSIEHNDFSYIEIRLKNLKDNIAYFEKTIYQNKAEGLYK